MRELSLARQRHQRAGHGRRFIFGQSLQFLERGPRKRAQLVAKSAEKLIEDEGSA